MSGKEWIGRLFEDLWGTAGRSGSLEAFRPELILCAALLAMLTVRMLLPRWRSSPFYGSAAGILAALGLVVGAGLPTGPREIFTGMLVVDGLAWYLRGLILLGGLVVVSLSGLTRSPSEEGYLEFYFLLMGAVLGMCLMVSANHLVMVMVGLEMASICSYVLAGLERDRRTGMEAALKYAVFGGATAGVMLYGMSLLAGVLGSVHLPTMARQWADLASTRPTGAGWAEYGPVLLLGGVMFLVGLGFKLSAFPLHFWAPDVMEGAPAEVGGFLSVVSKTAALGLLARLALLLCIPSKPMPIEEANTLPTVPNWQAKQTLQPAESRASAPAEEIAEPLTNPANPPVPALAPARQTFLAILALLAAVTCTFGNLAAYGQTNMKRLMAYSTIAHAGYLMMPVAAMLALAGRNPQAAQTALAALLFYATVYLWMNLGVFGFVAFMRDRIGREQIDAYRAIGRRSPGTAVLMAIQLFSLVGLPPLGGFMAKFTLFATLWQAGLGALLLIAVVNTVLSLFYYLRVIRVMVTLGDSDSAGPDAFQKSSVGPEGGSLSAQPPLGGNKPPVSEGELPMLSWAGLWLLAVCTPVVALGLWWNGLFALAQAAAARSW